MQIIKIKKPQELKYKKTLNKILKLAKLGVKSKNIKLSICFIIDDEAEKNLLNEFRVLKNNAFFKINNL